MILYIFLIFHKKNYDFMTFERLQKKYNIPENTRYLYIQLKEPIKSQLNINTFVIIIMNSEKSKSLPCIKLLS